MTGATRTRVQVVLTTGAKDPARARLGLEAALAAVASGVEVSVFLTLDATAWACEPRRFVCGTEVYALLDQLQELGALIACCSACASDQCGSGGGKRRAAAGPVAVEPPVVATTSGIQLLGLTALMERVAMGVPTVTF